MRKILLLILLLIPFNVFAYNIDLSTYDTKDLNGIIEDLKIDKKIEDKKEGYPIYVLYGRECDYSKDFINFYIDKVIPNYNDKVYLIGFEDWHNQDNTALFKSVLKYKNSSYDGSPLIVIGNRLFEGYTSSYDNQILSSISKLDNTNIFEEMNKIENKDMDNKSKLIIISILFVLLLILGIVFIKRKNNY